jgi:hypothetical protein
MVVIKGQSIIVWHRVIFLLEGSACMKLDITSKDLLVEKCEDGMMIVGVDITKQNFGLNWHRIGFRGELWS